MTTNHKISRVLGAAFLLQFVTSVCSGLILQPAWFVPGDISATMLKIADNPNLMKANILLDACTALGVIFLGAILYATLKKYGERMALVGLGFYILEGAMLAASRTQAFTLLRVSQEYVSAGRPDYMQTIAKLAFELMDFVGFTLHMLAFCLGAILFYYLLYRSGVVPRVLSLWGLITLLPLLVATLLAVFDIQFPEFVALPYFPFEFVIGVWILVKGVPEKEAPIALKIEEFATT